MDVGLLIISEPNVVPTSDNWFASRDGHAAIFCDIDRLRMRCRLAKQGTEYVAVCCGPYLIISIYISPSIGLPNFNAVLDDLSDAFSNRADRIIIGGDFNAKSYLWGSLYTDSRGRLLASWAAERDLRTANTGNTPTCVRPRGSSIVDITWTSPDLLPFIKNWCVKVDIESLSDHLYISFTLDTARPRPPSGRPAHRRWNLRKFNKDFFLATLHWRGHDPEVEDRSNITQMVIWLDQIMEEACDAAAPRVGPKKPCRQAYWWQDSVAVLRGNCTHARRLWQRAKRRKRSQAIIRELGFTYKQKRKELRMEINRLKSEAWQDLLNTLDEDPWGLPYRLVLKKLRKASPSLTETLDPEILSDLLDSLFPKNNIPDPLGDWRDFAWSDEWLIQQGEVQKVIQKRTTPSRKAPGPDGIRSIIWKRVPNKTLDWIRHIFNLCLIEGEFPTVWKCADLVLIPKGKTPNLIETRLPKVRPICLLNEIGKAFERILAERILFWQSEHPDSEFSANQFGFRRQRSTCDALLLVREITSRATDNKGFAFVISLDIKNAFNSIPWSVIRRALRRKGFPAYLCRVVDSYLSDRRIWYMGHDGKRHERAMEAGVPQGSVLGPILWNISFDGILDVVEDDNNDGESHIICYADDTLIVVTGRNLLRTRIRACVMANRVVNKIARLGLSVATEKTEAMLFYGKRTDDLPNYIAINDINVNLMSNIKYLGIFIDAKWSFNDHFVYIKEKAGRVIRALNRLMPNLRGPDERRRRLFANVILSVILYGAPVWGDEVVSNRLQKVMGSLERSVAQRVISAYRTVSSNAALLLARMPPLKFLAPMRKRVYDQLKRHREEEGVITRGTRNEIKETEFRRMCELWRGHLERPNTPGEYTKMAVVPRLETWMMRNHGSMSFHLTQLMTGHGSFGKFLCRIGKKGDPSCDLCGEDVDNALHVLKECPVWDPQRIELKRKLGLTRDFTLGDIIDAIISTSEHWRTFSAFAQEAMREKEEEERRRKRARTYPSSSSGDGGSSR
ncbi:unnamed protein product [Lasius platythorax]|uniref:Reverse transcriptase domain-containing protein n=3 Tax=Lasius TaxID=488720 RepID=A0AAV2NXS5_9HYME